MSAIAAPGATFIAGGGFLLSPAVVGAATTLLLDSIGTAATGAYSTRKLRAAYAGSAIRVRRSSDNTEQDIGFVSNDLDTASLTTFVGSNNGFITKWYDQSGNARDFAQATAGNQPKLVASGTIDTTINANPTIKFIASSSTKVTYATTGNLVSASAWTVLSIAEANTLASTSLNYASDALIKDQTDNFNPLIAATVSGTPKFGMQQYGGGSVISVNGALSTAYVTTSKWDGTNVKFYLNGGTGASHSESNLGSTTTTLIGGKNTFWDGWSNEIVFFNAALSSANINTLGANMATRAGTTWTNVS